MKKYGFILVLLFFANFINADSSNKSNDIEANSAITGSTDNNGQNEVDLKEEIFFTGYPKIKLSEDDKGRTKEELNTDKQIEYRCIISKIGNKFYWTSRESKLLIPNISGAFIIFTAIDGSGYIKIVDPSYKDMQTGSALTYDYREHLPFLLNSITYYGTTKLSEKVSNDVKKTQSQYNIKAYHTVEKGDSLYSLSTDYFGSGKYWNDIYIANKDTIGNKKTLQEGMLLKIPVIKSENNN